MAWAKAGSAEETCSSRIFAFSKTLSHSSSCARPTAAAFAMRKTGAFSEVSSVSSFLTSTLCLFFFSVKERKEPLVQTR